MISLRNAFRIMAFAGTFILTLMFIIPVHADYQKADAGQNADRFGDDLDRRETERSCPPESLFNPYTGNCAPIRNVKPVFEMRERSHTIQAPPSLSELRRHKGVLRNKSESFLMEDADIYVPGGIGAGITYKKGCLQALAHSELHTRMFVHPEGVNPSFPGLTWLFSTATNRIQKSIEVAGLYRGSNPGWLGVFDWSCSSDYPCQGGQTDGSWIWTIHFSNFPCNINEIIDQGGHLQQVMQYANQTIRLDDGIPPLWRSAVYLWNFCNNEWDLVYDHEYRVEKADCSKDNSCAWWGPILETFDDALPQINELGFEDTLLLHDGVWSTLPPMEATFRNPSVPWVLFHIDPNRGFGAGNYVERYVIQNDLESFLYQDDVFYGTHRPAYASGAFTPTGGYEDTDGLHVVVGDVDSKWILDGMSGGWSRDFELDRMSDVQIGVKYRLMTSGYDADECGEALLAVDGDTVKHLETLCGRGLDTGWKTETVTLNLPPGIHTLTVGAYNNKKTAIQEKTDAYFDDISVKVVSAYSPEVDCGNGIDEDGDGLVDCDDPDCADSPVCANLPVLSADFDECGDEFVYGDDKFFGTKRPQYASGTWSDSGGDSGSGGLHLAVGNVDTRHILDGMSGGWSRDFELDRKSDVAILLKYRLVTSGYDADECGEALVAVNGDIVKHLAALCGRGLDTGWKTETVTLNLAPGIHTLTVGAYNNKKTAIHEKTDAYFDDISVTVVSTYSPEVDCGNGIDDDGDGLVDCDDPDCADSPACMDLPVLSADFDECGDELVYGDDKFYGTKRPQYASGTCSDTAGTSGSGGLHLTLGNVDTRYILDGMSGGWTGGFHLSAASEVEVSLDYRLVMTQFDADECAQVLVQIDDGPVEVLEEFCGRGKDTGWQIATFARPLEPGDHIITIGGYNNKKTAQGELADIYFDNLDIR